MIFRPGFKPCPRCDSTLKNQFEKHAKVCRKWPTDGEKGTPKVQKREEKRKENILHSFQVSFYSKYKMKTEKNDEYFSFKIHVYLV